MKTTCIMLASIVMACASSENDDLKNQEKRNELIDFYVNKDTGKLKSRALRYKRRDYYIDENGQYTVAGVPDMSQSVDPSKDYENGKQNAQLLNSEEEKNAFIKMVKDHINDFMSDDSSLGVSCRPVRSHNLKEKYISNPEMFGFIAETAAKNNLSIDIDFIQRELKKNVPMRISFIKTAYEFNLSNIKKDIQSKLDSNINNMNNDAASDIQRVWKGYKLRKDLPKIKAEIDATAAQDKSDIDGFQKKVEEIKNFYSAPENKNAEELDIGQDFLKEEINTLQIAKDYEKGKRSPIDLKSQEAKERFKKYVIDHSSDFMSLSSEIDNPDAYISCIPKDHLFTKYYKIVNTKLFGKIIQTAENNKLAIIIPVLHKHNTSKNSDIKLKELKETFEKNLESAKNKAIESIENLYNEMIEKTAKQKEAIDANTKMANMFSKYKK